LREISLVSFHGTCRHDWTQTQYILTYYYILYYKWNSKFKLVDDSRMILDDCKQIIFLIY